jgi:hypothetical protein
MQACRQGRPNGKQIDERRRDWISNSVSTSMERVAVVPVAVLKT